MIRNRTSPPLQKKIIRYAIAATVVIIVFFSGNETFAGKPAMVFIEGGTFTMGKNNEEHQVTISNFKISKYEITNEQYCTFLNDRGNQKEGGENWLDVNAEGCLIMKKDGKFVSKAGKENHPVVEVTWYGARAYCKWAGGRLPTEAEWEYAARGGKNEKGYKYSGSDDINDVAWYIDNSENRLHRVGTKKPNELGIYDMSGNLWEWCNDWYDSNYYNISPGKNPKGPEKGLTRVYRGGAWLNGASDCCVAFRNDYNPGNSRTYIGFRMVLIP